ncbi:hypothetical protein C0989_001026 [Termitomyces sp. Mn162]|nr:hypothetical protein C0989_001026 [Termitomyces sp. Mn162]
MRTPRRHCPREPDAPTPSLTPENEPSVTNGGMEDNSRRIPACPKVALLANQSSLHLAASSSAHSASPPGTCPHPSASPMGCPSICVRHSCKPRTSNAHSITTCTDVFLSRSITSFSICATSQSSLACQSSPSHAANDIVKTSTCLQRKTSVIKGIGAGGLNNPSKGTPRVREKRRDSGGPADSSRPCGLLLGPTPKDGEPWHFPCITTKDAPFPDHPATTLPSPQTAPCSPPSAMRDETWSASGPPGNPPPPLQMTLQKPRQSSQEDKSTPLTTPVPDTSMVPTLKLLPPTVIHHHLIQIRRQQSGGDYWNAGGRHDKIWEILGYVQGF